MTGFTKDQIADVFIQNRSGLTNKEFAFYEKLVHLIIYRGEEIPDGYALFSSSNRLKDLAGGSKATCNRYIKKLTDTKKLIRRKGGFRKPSVFILCSASLKNETRALESQNSFKIETENDTLVNTSINKYNQSINHAAGSRWISILKEYDYYKSYSGSGMTVFNHHYTTEQVIDLMTFLDKDDLERFADDLPEKFNRQYIINGLFIRALKNKKLQESLLHPENTTHVDEEDPHSREIMLDEAIEHVAKKAGISSWDVEQNQSEDGVFDYYNFDSVINHAMKKYCYDLDDANLGYDCAELCVKVLSNIWRLKPSKRGDRILSRPDEIKKVSRLSPWDIISVIDQFKVKFESVRNKPAYLRTMLLNAAEFVVG